MYASAQLLIFRPAFLLAFVLLASCDNGKTPNTPSSTEDDASAKLNDDVDEAGPAEPPERRPAEVDSAKVMRERLQQIEAAWMSYVNQYGHFPPLAIASDNGKPLLSWRVALLQFIDRELFKQFELNEPWDSEHNMALVDKMPDCFKAPNDDEDVKFKSRMLLVVGDGYVYDPGLPRLPQFRDVMDGGTSTLVAVEVDDEHAVTWTKPGDLIFDVKAPRKGLRKWREGRFWALTAYGQPLEVNGRAFPDESLVAMFTRRGKEDVSDARIIQPGEQRPELLHTLKGRANSARMSTFGFSSDSSTMLAFSSYVPSVVRFWDLYKGKELLAFQSAIVEQVSPNSRRVDQLVDPKTMALGPTGKVFCGSARDKGKPIGIKFWKTATGEELKLLKDIRADYTVFSPDGKRLLSAGITIKGDGEMDRQPPQSTVQIWDWENGKRLAELTLTSGRMQGRSVRSMAFSRDGSSVVIQPGQNGVLVWKPDSGKKPIAIGTDVRMSQFAISPDGKRLVMRRSLSGDLHCWDMETGKQTKMWKTPLIRVEDFCFQPDGKTIAACDLHWLRKHVALIDIEAGRITKRLELPGQVISARFAPDGRTLATGMKDGSITVWKLPED